MTEDDVRRIVLSMKDCLRESHIACETCSPGFDERMRVILDRERAEWRKQMGLPPTVRATDQVAGSET